jgi:hypothetical protein
MGSGRRFALAEFLSKPRSLYEIAEHYGFSKKTAVFHLQKAVKSGQVLVSEAPAFRTIKDSSGNLRKLIGFVYIYQRRPSLIGKDIRPVLPKTDNSVSVRGKTSRTSLIAEPHTLFRKSSLKHQLPSFAYPEKMKTQSCATKPIGNRPSISKLNMSPTSARSANNTRSACVPLSIHNSNSKSKPFLYVDKTRLFKALLDRSLPFLDLHDRFYVSRQTITRLVKKGLLSETWGSKGVGVTFKLTSKGKTYLRQLEAASTYERKIKESPLTRLKQRTFV